MTEPVQAGRPSAENRRVQDQLMKPMFIVGCLFIAAGIALEALHAIPDKAFYGILILGAGCLPTHRFIEALTIWRRNGNGESKPS